MNHPQIHGKMTATPSKETGWRYKFTANDGRVFWLGGLAAPRGDVPEGTEGYVQYTKFSTSYADYAFHRKP